MNKINFRSVAVAVLALGTGLAVPPSFARTLPVATPSQQDVGADEGLQTASPVFGQYSCGFNELHTHLQRRFCTGSSVGAGSDRGGF